MVWLQGPKRSQNFFNHLSTLRPSLQFAMEIESDSAVLFLHILVMGKGMALAAKVYRKPSHTGQYLNFKSHLPRM
jgi:hypothetical protein